MQSDNSNKATLINAIRELLQKGTVKTQEDIRNALQAQGLTINQTKISRVLHKLGAIKLNEGNQVAYRLPAELVTVTSKNSLNQLVLSVNHNESLIVIRTAPGSAQLVARVLDSQKQLGILGTVAGDDTIFIAPDSIESIATISQKISKVLLG